MRYGRTENIGLVKKVKQRMMEGTKSVKDTQVERKKKIKKLIEADK